MSDQISDLLSKQILSATDMIEKQVDKQLEKYSDLTDMTFENFASEIDAIRVKRLADMKKEAEMRKIYLSQVTYLKTYSYYNVLKVLFLLV